MHQALFHSELFNFLLFTFCLILVFFLLLFDYVLSCLLKKVHTSSVEVTIKIRSLFSLKPPHEKVKTGKTISTIFALNCTCFDKNLNPLQSLPFHNKEKPDFRDHISHLYVDPFR